MSQLLDRLLSATLACLMAALVINVLWQVATRFLLDDPSSVTEEIARFLLLWIGLLGACYAYRRGSHLGLDVATARLGPAGRDANRKLVLLMAALFACIVLIYGGGRLMWLTLELRQTSAALAIPMGYVYSVLPLSGLLIAFYSVAGWRAPAQLH